MDMRALTLFSSVAILAFSSVVADVKTFTRIGCGTYQPMEDELLEYARENGYQYIICERNLKPPHGDRDDWEQDGWGNLLGYYNWSGLKKLYEALKSDFIKTEQYGLRYVPYIKTGSRWAESWLTINDYVVWNYDPGGVAVNSKGDTVAYDPSMTPSFAPKADGLDLSFYEYLEVIAEAYNDANVSYPLEYIHIGHNESITKRPGNPPETMMAKSSYIDMEWIDQEGNDAEAYERLYASHIGRRVSAIRDVFEDSVITLLWGDGLDPQQFGGKHAETVTPNVTVQTYKALTHNEMQSQAYYMIIMPQRYTPYVNIGSSGFYQYKVDSTLSNFTDNGYRFISSSAFTVHVHGEPSGFPYANETIEKWAQGRQMLHEWVRVASRPEYDWWRVGFNASSFGENGLYWNDDPRPLQFLVMPELAKAAKFYPMKTDFVKLRESSGSYYADVFESDGAYYNYQSSYYVGASSNSLKILPINLDGSPSGDRREDLLNIWTTGSYLLFRTTFAPLPVTYSTVPGISSTNRFLPGDINGNGKTDIIRAWDDGGDLRLDVFQSDGAGYGSAPTWTSGSNIGSWTALDYLAGDFNRNGLTDVAKVSASGSALNLDIFASTGDSLKHCWSNPSWIGGSGAIKFFVGDFDRDGRADIYQLWNNSLMLGIEVYRADGDACDVSFSLFSGNSNVGGLWHTVEFLAGDVNANGKMDIVAIRNVNGAREFQSYIANGTQGNGTSPGFTTYTNSSLGTFQTASKFRLVDEKGNGTLSILEQFDIGGYSCHNIYEWTGSGFAPATVGCPSSLGTTVDIITLDITGDY
jgi:hypothetical protein